MPQVIQLHPYKHSYPFGLQKQTQFTYVQLIKPLHSDSDFHFYLHNLSLFKSLPTHLLIPLDSYLKQSNTLQLYYHYQPLSIKSFIQEKLLLVTDYHLRDKFLTKIITTINLSIEDIISLLISHKIMALLSIDNMAIAKHDQIKYFIQPDFQFVQKPSPNQLIQYYNTQKKKLQIQLQQFLQHIFSHTNTKPKQNNKANFVIQGTKLVFVNDEETKRQSSMSGVGVIPITSNAEKTGSSNHNISSNSNSTINQQKHEIKLPAYMLKQPKENKESQDQSNVINNSKQKFDIKNILDEKKLQKNQSHHVKQTVPKDHNEPSRIDKSQGTNSFTEANDQVSTKNHQKNNQKNIKNYFENNDDFNKDASFYPEQFIKEDSIAQFQGYEDQLEKQLEDLKKKKYQAEQIANTSKNRLSMVPNTPINPQIIDPKISKSLNQQQAQYLKPPNAQNQYGQNVLNSSDSRQNDTSQQQQKQKKKYKVTITTSHMVDVEDQNVDLKTIEQELIEDIRKGTIRNNIEKGNIDKQIIDSHSIPVHLLKGHNRENNYQKLQDEYTQQNSSNHLQRSGTNIYQENVSQERGFSKQLYPHMSSQPSTFSSQMGVGKEFNQHSSGTFTLGGSASTSSQQAPDIKKIIEKIKNNSQNSQFINSTNISQGAANLNQNNMHVKQMQYTQQSPQKHRGFYQEQENRPHSHISSHLMQTTHIINTNPHISNTNQQVNNGNSSQGLNSDRKQNEKEYYDKIQKAKMKAQEIMKLVKERKGQ